MAKYKTIEPSSSPWNTRVVMAHQKGKTRMCFGFTDLNKVTVPEIHPIPRVDESLDRLGTAKVFSVLDLAAGFFQIPLREESKPLTAFTVGHNRYQFNRLPFGLRNAPMAFQAHMQSVLAGLHLMIVLVYIDDIIVFSETMEEHKEHLQFVLARLRQHGLGVKVTKCQLCRPEVTYLGFVINEGGIQKSQENVDRIQRWPVPNNRQEARKFLGETGFYRRFVRDYSAGAAAMHRFAYSDQPFQWLPAHQSQFDDLKQALAAEVTLAHPDFSKPLHLQTDASRNGLGAILSQKHGR